MITVFILIIIAVAIGTTRVLHRYISFKKTPLYVYVMVWIGWFMCFGIVVLVPIDILSTKYRECLIDINNQGSQNSSQEPYKCENEPLSYINDQVIYYFYQTFYFGTLLLTWLIYPFLGSFVLAGDFKLTERIQRAVKENLFLYTAFGVIGIIIMIWLLVVKRFDWNSLVGYVMAAANTWGLILVILLMGYGLVEIPRAIWNHSNRVLILRHLQFKLSTLVESKRKTHDELFATLKAVKKIADRTRKFDPYEKYVEIILEQCPPEYSTVIHGEGSGEITYPALVALNQRLKNALTYHRRSEFLYDQCLNEAFEIEDIMNSYGNVDKRVHWSYKEPRQGRFSNQLNSLEWMWYNYLEVPILWIMTGWFAIMSIIIIWSELSVAITSNDVSILSNIFKHSNVNNIGIQFILFFPLGYEALTTYSTLFKVRIFNYYRLIPHQHSDSNSIIFSAAYLCRLAAPLCYNFTTFIDSKTQFTFKRVMGNMDYTPFLGTYFYIYFPVLILIVCLCTLFNLYSRIMNCLQIQRFRFDSDFDHENIDEGKVLVDGERRKRANARKAMEIDQQMKNNGWGSTSGKPKYSLLRNAFDDDDDYDTERATGLNNSIDIYNGGGYNHSSSSSSNNLSLNNSRNLNNSNNSLGNSSLNNNNNNNRNSLLTGSGDRVSNGGGSGSNNSSPLNGVSPGPSPSSERLKLSFNGFPSMQKIFGSDKNNNNNNNRQNPSRGGR